MTAFADFGAMEGFAGRAKTSLPRITITVFGFCHGWQKAGDVLEAYSLASIEARPTFTCYMELLSRYLIYMFRVRNWACQAMEARVRFRHCFASQP